LQLLKPQWPRLSANPDEARSMRPTIVATACLESPRGASVGIVAIRRNPVDNFGLSL
jgi:hypothetical protein